VALGGQGCAALAVPFFDLGEAVVDGAGKMGAGALGLAADQRAVVEKDDASAGLGEQVGGGETCDAAANHAHIGLRAFGQRVGPRHFGFGPDGARIGKG
jgi:hypothetical protein